MELFSEMMTTIRLINALLGFAKCGECEGCSRPRCRSCTQCRDEGICLHTVCLDGLSRSQINALRVKHEVLQEDSTRRSETNKLLMTEVYIRATNE